LDVVTYLSQQAQNLLHGDQGAFCLAPFLILQGIGITPIAAKAL
jgi:hypothetical protein